MPPKGYGLSCVAFGHNAHQVDILEPQVRYWKNSRKPPPSLQDLAPANLYVNHGLCTSACRPRLFDTAAASSPLDTALVVVKFCSFVVSMASPQPPPGPHDSGDNNSSSSKAAAAAAPSHPQPVLDVFGGDAYAAVFVCALLIMGMTQGRT